MKKSDLEARLKQLNCVSSDSENDFDEIVSSARSPNDTAKITVIPLERLVEYSDATFESITGRPQPFKAHSQESLESLSKSIKENGVINPIIVRPLDDGKYQILAGRNRARASRICGKTDIPAIIRADIKTLSNMIGHSSVATTLDIYSHITDEMLKNASRVIDRGIGKEMNRPENEIEIAMKQ